RRHSIFRCVYLHRPAPTEASRPGVEAVGTFGGDGALLGVRGAGRFDALDELRRDVLEPRAQRMVETTSASVPDLECSTTSDVGVSGPREVGAARSRTRRARR